MSARFRTSFINHLIIVGISWFVVLLFLFYSGNIIYSSPEPALPAYNIAAGDDSVQATEAIIAPVSFAGFLRKADVERGARVFGRCSLCHAVSRNGGSRIGPNLRGVLERLPASVSSFNYSRAMKNFASQGYVWDFATLDAFLMDPRRVVPGTIMSFPGIESDQERADILLYLDSLSDTPVILEENRIKNSIMP